jgi:hypothetical protein
LCFQRIGAVGTWILWSEECSGTREIALGLYDSRLIRERIRVVRRDVEDLIKLSQRFWETTKDGIRKRVVSKQPNVARVKPLGFVKIGLAPVPLALPPRNIG